MLDCQEKKKGIVKSTSVTSFIPRQLLLSSSSSKSKMVQQAISLIPQDRVDLLHTICQFLDLNGFRKTLKKFCDEADIKESGWKDCSVNLEKMFQEHLRTSNDANKKTKEIQFEDEEKLEATLENGALNGNDIKPKKKKKNKNIEPVGDTLSEPEKAVKKSKKNKQKDLGEQTVADSVSVPSEPLKKSKEKKKQHKDELEVSDKDSQGGKLSKKADDVSLEVNEEKKEKKKSKKIKEEVLISKVGVDEDEKRSKKRKKSSSDENATGYDEDDSKRRKMDVSDKEGVEENNRSVEPTSAKAFQRVKVEEVKFVDERLKDNSYWAKDGADSGYGAKAQEVLGQVRGKDFRHEKTKKKRGTYRGGQIDLQSHSIKFNYDEEE